VGPLEGGTVVASDRACLRQGPCIHSVYVVAARRDCSGHPSALAAHAYTGGERGHWEGDLLGGTKNSHIATRVERHSRFTTLVKVPSKDTTAVVAARSRHVRKLPASLRRSLTRDRGLEMAKHKSFTVATNVKVYLCDPQSPWQRGTNENTNGLRR
jgi:IS30 family transposase